jgi:phage gp46-like protein
MPLTGTGRNLALTDAGNGRVTVVWGADGNPVFDDALGEVVFSLLLETAGWFGDHGGKRRTLLPTVKVRDSSTPGKLEEYARDALQVAIDDGRLRSVSPTVQPSGLGFLLTVAYVTSAGRESSVTVPLTV